MDTNPRDCEHAVKDMDWFLSPACWYASLLFTLQEKGQEKVYTVRNPGSTGNEGIEFIAEKHDLFPAGGEYESDLHESSFQRVEIQQKDNDSIKQAMLLRGFIFRYRKSASLMSSYFFFIIADRYCSSAATIEGA